MNLPFEDNSFDHVYAIESVCHAPDKVYYDNFSLQKNLLCFSSIIIFSLNVLLKFSVYLNQVVHLLVMMLV